MATVLKLTKSGEAFIRTKAANDDLLSGKYNYGLPFSTIRNSGITFTANVKNVSTYVAAPALDNYTTEILSGTSGNNRFGELLIHWFNKYGEQYSVDPNIIAAQSFNESAFRTWSYSGAKTNPNFGGALGITQFVAATIFDVIVQNKFKSGSAQFTTSEQNLIKNNLTGNTGIISAYTIKDFDRTTAKLNRSILHQNVMDNPELMIKAQCVLMDYIGRNNANIAASSLFAYNAGSTLKSKNYNDMLLVASPRGNIKSDKVKEATNYVKRIIDLLNSNFGYRFDTASLEASTAQSAGSYKG
jgi:hypothetical protein